MPSPVPPDTTARLTALAEMAAGHAEAAAWRANAAERLSSALRASGLTGRESVRRAAVRALSGVRREVDRAELHAASAAGVLELLRCGDVEAADAGALLVRAARRSARALAAATGALGRAARLLAGLAACSGGHTGAAALWARGWEVLLTIDLGEVPVGRLRIPRTRADAEAEVAGVVAHLQAQAPAFLVLEVAGRDRWVRAHAHEVGVRVESVSNRFLDRSRHLTRAEVSALLAAGVLAPDEVSPNWFVDVPEAPPSVAAGLLVQLLEVHDPGLRHGFRIRTVADEQAPAERGATCPHHGHPDDEEPEVGTLVEGIAGSMLVVEATDPEVESHASALAQVVDPWVRALGWGGVVVTVDQPRCAFAAEVAPSGPSPVARLLPYIEAPPEVEAALQGLGWHVAEEAGQPWWRRQFAPASDAREVLDLVVDTLHAVCGLQLERRLLLQVAPA